MVMGTENDPVNGYLGIFPVLILAGPLGSLNVQAEKSQTHHSQLEESISLPATAALFLAHGKAGRAICGWNRGNPTIRQCRTEEP
jgi:hypothetical protein